MEALPIRWRLQQYAHTAVKDQPVLSRWARVLMMVQASVSLTTIALLAARSINIL